MLPLVLANGQGLPVLFGTISFALFCLSLTVLIPLVHAVRGAQEAARMKAPKALLLVGFVIATVVAAASAGALVFLIYHSLK